MRLGQLSAPDIVRKMKAREKRFAPEFYRWALRDAQREYSTGFPFLGRIKSTTVIDYLEFVDKLSPTEKRIFRVGMVKRVHPAGALLAGDTPSERESQLVERFLTRNLKYNRLLGRVLVPSRAEAKRWGELSSGSKKYQINWRKLRAMLKKQLAPTLGDRIETFRSDLYWRYPTPVGKWTVYTWVDTGGRLSQLSYDHAVCLRPHVYLLERTSIFGWLGVPAGGWDVLTNADITDAAKLIADLSSHFINAMSKIQVILANKTRA
jgi:hypothetical protein